MSLTHTFEDVKVEIDTKEFELELGRFLDENAETIAKQIRDDAKASVNVVTGNLKRGIKAKKSKFDGGGWIVQATAPHSWLVEYGHGGKKPAPAHPYLKPALDKNIKAAIREFGAK